MKTKVSPAIVGAFVIGAFALGIVALLTFGGVNFFHKPQRFVVFFDESIHGLDQGSPVKLRGLRVGRVVALTMRYDDANNRSVAAVVCELDRDAIVNSKGQMIDVASRAQIEALVKKGLRGQLQVQALATGLLFVELNFYEPAEYPVDPGLTDARYAVVPAVKSTISEFQASLSDILTNLKKTDLAGLAKGLSDLIADTRKQLNGLDLKGAVEQWKKTGAQIEALAANPDFKRTFDNLNGAVTELRATIGKLDAQVEPTANELKVTLGAARKTMETFNGTADEVRRFVMAHGGLGAELTGSLQHLNEAAAAVTQLVEFLERNPNALITGRKKPQ